MEQLLAAGTRRKRTFPSLINFRLIIPGLEFFNTLSNTALVYRQCIFTPRLSSYGKRFSFALCFFFFFGSHAAPSLGANSERSTAPAVLKHLVRNAPYEVRRADFRCPDLTAMMVPPQAGFGEVYVPCEAWDAFQAAMRSGNRTAAEKLILILKPRTTEGK